MLVTFRPSPKPEEKAKSQEFKFALQDCIVQLQGVIDKRQKVLDQISSAMSTRNEPVAPNSALPSLFTGRSRVESMNGGSTLLANGIRELQNRIKTIKSQGHSSSTPSQDSPKL